MSLMHPMVPIKCETDTIAIVRPALTLALQMLSGVQTCVNAYFFDLYKDQKKNKELN